MQVLEVPTAETQPTGESPKMTFDPAWLAISRAFQPLLSLHIQQQPLPSDPTILKATIEKELAWIRENLQDGGAPEVSSIQRFERTAPAPGEPGGDAPGPGKPTASAIACVNLTSWAAGSWYTNPQTEAFCRMLRLENKINPVPAEFRQQQQQPATQS